MTSLDAFVNEKIAQRKAKSTLRHLEVTEPLVFPEVRRGGNMLISFSCNDTLGLAGHPKVIAASVAATQRYGAGARASRHVSGNHPCYAPLEQALAAWKNAEAALVYGSGYLANIGAISALMDEHDLIIADKLAHACMLDGAKLSGAKLFRFSHNDTMHCERLLREQRGRHRHCLLLTEGVFSMDGDRAPLADLRTLANTYDAWLLVDDAHAVGVLNDGHGSAAGADILVGTLSKALGGYGGYVCASRAAIDYLTTSSRSAMYTTGLPPGVVAAATEALNILAREPDRANRPLALARRFTEALRLPDAESPIVPLLLGESEAALQAAEALKAEGFLVSAIRPPTVPPGTARLRFSFSAAHTDAHVEALVAAIRRLGLAPRD